MPPTSSVLLPLLVGYISADPLVYVKASLAYKAPMFFDATCRNCGYTATTLCPYNTLSYSLEFGFSTEHLLRLQKSRSKARFGKMISINEAAQFVQSKPSAVFLALVTHYVLYNSEWDNGFHVFLGAWMVAFSGVLATEYIYDEHIKSVGAAAQVMATVAAVYFGTLTTSILIHRGFFHRLRRVWNKYSPSVHH